MVSLIPGSINQYWHWVAYLANPTSGTLAVSYPAAVTSSVWCVTLKDAAQVNPIDDKVVTTTVGGTSKTTTVTTTVGYDILLSFGASNQAASWSSYGAGETDIQHGVHPSAYNSASSWKAAAASAGSESMTVTYTNNPSQIDEAVVAIKAYAVAASVSTTTIYRARVDDGSHNSYTFTNNTWIVYDKKGNKCTYGSSDSGRMYDTSTGTSTKTYRWMLQETRDLNGNYITYTYLRDNNVLYPYQIKYTGNGLTDGISTLTFATTTRPDIRQSFAPGFSATTTKRISQISASVNGTTVREYLLGYGTGNNGFRSLLTSVQHQGYDDGGSLTLLPATTFAYMSTSTQFYKPNAIEAVDGQKYVIADTADLGMIALKAGNGITGTTTSNTYTYAGTGTANPHAVTQLSNGLSTTTYQFDNNGNVLQKLTDGVLTTYEWDYANRLIAIGSGGASTTYGYDAFGARVLQTSATTTNINPFKWFSVASSTGTGARYSTTTEYIWTPSGDTLVATVDQQFASGVATGTAQTSYIHPDHLGSTNVITNASGTVISTTIIIHLAAHE
jgi:YD repeat-containing protein